MTRWFSTTQIIIIHRRQIIMNQTHGVNHFDRDGGRHGTICLVTKHVASGQTQNGTNTLATRHEGVLHGFDNLVRLGFGRDERFIEGLLDQGQSFGKVALQIKLRLGGGCGSFGKLERLGTAKRCRCRCKGIRDAHDGETDEAKGRKAHRGEGRTKKWKMNGNRGCWKLVTVYRRRRGILEPATS